MQTWQRVDARYKGQSHVGALTSRRAALVTAAVACCSLVTLRYLVMDSDVQGQLGAAFVAVVARAVPAWGPWALRHQSLWTHLTWISGCLLVYVAVPTVVLRTVFKLPPQDGFLQTRGYLRHLPLYGLLFLPVGVLVLLAARQPDFQLQYPFFVGQSAGEQWAWEIAYGSQFFALEYFFRGFILRGLAAEMGASAVLAMAMPYCMLHYGKPLPECLGSILAGMALGLLALDTGSIWGGVTIHVAVAWSMDGAALLQRATHPKF